MLSSNFGENVGYWITCEHGKHYGTLPYCDMISNHIALPRAQRQMWYSFQFEWCCFCRQPIEICRLWNINLTTLILLDNDNIISHKWYFNNFCDSFEIWQAPLQQRCRDAYQISKRYDHFNTQISRLRDFMRFVSKKSYRLVNRCPDNNKDTKAYATRVITWLWTLSKNVCFVGTEQWLRWEVKPANNKESKGLMVPRIFVWEP